MTMYLPSSLFQAVNRFGRSLTFSHNSNTNNKNADDILEVIIISFYPISFQTVWIKDS